MAQYILLYKGPAWDMSDANQDRDAEAAKWGAWMERVGPKLINFGAPMINGVSIVDDGSSSKPADLNGYSILEADSLDAAKKLVDGHPHLSGEKGVYSVDIFELVPMEM